MKRFIANQPNNFIQFYFEEAHNLFPKKEDKDLSQIYNRLAKEGAKLNEEERKAIEDQKNGVVPQSNDQAKQPVLKAGK